MLNACLLCPCREQSKAWLRLFSFFQRERVNCIISGTRDVQAVKVSINFGTTFLQEDYEPPTIPFDLPNYLPPNKQNAFGVEIRGSKFCLNVGHVSSRVIQLCVFRTAKLHLSIMEHLVLCYDQPWRYHRLELQLVTICNIIGNHGNSLRLNANIMNP